MATLKNRSKNILILLFIITIGAMVVVQALRRAASRLSSNFFHPFISAPSSIESTVSKKSLLLESKTSLVSMIEELQGKNDELSARFTARRQLESENAQLRKLLKLKPYGGYKCIFAELVLRDPAFWEERFTIDKGAADGIKEGAIVLVADSLNDRKRLAVIGRVKSAQKHSSIVSTLASKECQLSVVLPQSKSAGLTNGGSKTTSGLTIEVVYLPRDIKYRAGEPVYTSGLTPYTPPALLVGKLAGSEGNPKVRIHDNLYFDGEIIPSADLEKVRFVMIMVESESTQESKENN